MSNQRQTGSAASETGAAQQATKATVGQEQLIPAEGKVIWKLQDFVRRHGIFLVLALLIVISALLPPASWAIDSSLRSCERRWLLWRVVLPRHAT